ncbi:MAG: S9 family peptidase, partial [Sphingomonadaceae bacterium]|nr:S9 family peptidase [Sphingomonadaceae bacterium]
MTRIPIALACMTMSAALAAEPIAYPPTATVPVVETRFGEQVADPYRWLEGDVRTDAKVRGWTEAENRVTEKYLAALPGRDVFMARMRALQDFERYGIPREAGGRYFYTYNTGLQNQSTLWVREGLEGAPRLLIDPNAWAKDGATALAEWAASEDGGLLAYAVQDGGTDWRTIHVLNVATGKPLSDEVRWVKFSNTAWLKDGSGFFYSRFPEPDGRTLFTGEDVNQSVWLHRIGTPQSVDIEIYATPRDPKLSHTARVTDDGRYLLITTTRGTDPRNAVEIARLDGSAIRPRALVAGLDHNWDLAGAKGASLWFVTDLGAPRQRIVVLDAEHPARAPRPVVPEVAETLVGASLVGDRLVVAYLGDAKSQAELWTLDGRRVGGVALPGIGTAVGFAGRNRNSESFFSFSSFATPPTVYRYDTATNRAALFAAPRVAFDPQAYDTHQIFFPSKDGTRV